MSDIILAVEPLTSITVAVVDRDPDIADMLASEVDRLGTVTRATSLESAMSPVTGPAVIVFGPSGATPEGIGELGALVRHRALTGAVLVAESPSTALMRAAMRAGVADVVSLYDEPADLVAAIQAVAADVAGRAEPAATPPPLAATDGKHARVTTVFSTKGGVGKSVVAVNLATSLARQSGQPVVILDADFLFGDVALMLGVTPRHTVVDAVAAGERLDSTLLHSLLELHPASGVSVLAAPLEPGFADQVDQTCMARVIQLLRTMAAHVVVDTPATFSDVVLGLLDVSDDIVVVASMDVPSIKNVKVGIQALRLLNVSVTKVKLLLNRANSRVGLEVGDVERTLQLKADVTMPSEIEVPQSINKGVPFVLDAPKAKVSRSVDELARSLLRAPAASRAAGSTQGMR